MAAKKKSNTFLIIAIIAIVIIAIIFYFRGQTGPGRALQPSAPPYSDLPPSYIPPGYTTPSYYPSVPTYTAPRPPSAPTYVAPQPTYTAPEPVSTPTTYTVPTVPSGGTATQYVTQSQLAQLAQRVSALENEFEAFESTISAGMCCRALTDDPAQVELCAGINWIQCAGYSTDCAWVAC